MAYRRRIFWVVAITLEGLGIGIEEVQAAVDGPDPEVFPAILENGSYARVAQARRIVGVVLKPDEGAGGRIEPVETATVGAYPNGAAAIDENVEHGILGEAYRVGGILLIDLNVAARCIQAVESQVRAYPNAAGRIFIQRCHDVAREPSPILAGA